MGETKLYAKLNIHPDLPANEIIARILYFQGQHGIVLLNLEETWSCPKFCGPCSG